MCGATPVRCAEGFTAATGHTLKTSAGATPDTETNIAAVRRRLAAFKVPARLWWVDAFVVVNSANGTKVQRNQLREIGQAHLDQVHSRDQGRPGPSTPVATLKA